MEGVTALSVVIALGIGTSQLAAEGLEEFLNRPAGVGASPSKVDTGTATATAPPEVAQLVPPAAAVPIPAPIQPDLRARPRNTFMDRTRHHGYER
jgi:hypothetical protein